MENLENNKKEHLIITGIEEYRPEKIIDNKQLEKELTEHEDKSKHYKYLVENPDLEDPIYQKVGIKNRPTVDKDEATTDMSVKATEKLLEKNPLDPQEKNLILVGTLSNEHRYPSVAAKTMDRLHLNQEKGFEKTVGFDIGAACSGWTYGIETASAMMVAKGYMSAVVISSDTMTQLVNKHDKSRIVFGDGATALMIKKETIGMKGFRILDTEIVTYPQDLKDVMFPTELALDTEEKEKMRMNLRGGDVYRAGVNYSADFINRYLKERELSLENIDYIIPHQANGSMLKSLAEKLQVTKNKYGEEKVLSNIENTGNTAASSIPLALFDFKQKGQFKNGDRILMCSFGAGYTLGIVDVEVVL